MVSLPPTVASSTWRPAASYAWRRRTALRGFQVRQLPAEALAEVTGARNDWGHRPGKSRSCWLALGGVVVVHPDQDHLLEAHVKGQLQGHVGNRGAFP